MTQTVSRTPAAPLARPRPNERGPSQPLFLQYAPAPSGHPLQNRSSPPSLLAANQSEASGDQHAPQEGPQQVRAFRFRFASAL
jgi:hypothetical protein